MEIDIINHYKEIQILEPFPHHSIKIDIFIFIVIIYTIMTSTLDLKRYDRQNRTYGTEATSSLSNSTIIINGLSGGLATETCKNLLLSGVQNIMISTIRSTPGWIYFDASGFTFSSPEIKVKFLPPASAASASAIAGIVADADGNFGVETQKLGQHIAALNNVYELQLKSSQDYLNSTSQMNQLQESIKNVMSDLASSAQDTQIYRENMSLLSKNLTELNTVYGNMLRALKG